MKNYSTSVFDRSHSIPMLLFTVGFVVVLSFVLRFSEMKWVYAATATVSCDGDPDIEQGVDFNSSDDLILVGNGTCTLINSSTLTSLKIASSTAQLDLANDLDVTVTDHTIVSGTIRFGQNNEWNGAGSFTVANGGTVTHDDYTTAVLFEPSVSINITGALTVASGGDINVDGKGYLGGYSGLNANRSGRTEGNTLGSDERSGGSHGGRGGVWSNAFASDVAASYGVMADPSTAGGGGGAATGNTSISGGDGGGVISIVATGGVMVSGTVSANGLDSTLGSGAGGSIKISVGPEDIGGNGTIRANAGSASVSGGGGGGRVALIASSGNVSDSLIITAYGDASDGDNEDGSAGTVYVHENEDGTYGDLLIDNNGIDDAYFATELSSIEADDIWVTDYGRLFYDGSFFASGVQVDSNSVMEIDNDFAQFSQFTSSTFYLNGGVLQFNGTFSMPTFDTSGEGLSGRLITYGTTTVSTGDIIIDGFTWEIGGPVQKTASTNIDSFIIESGGRISHLYNTTSETSTLELTVGELNVKSGGSIDVEGRGYMGGRSIVQSYYSSGILQVITNNTDFGRTKGNVTVAQGYDLCGGSHGGRGGRYRNGTSGIGCGTAAGLEPHDVYDSIWDPQYPGSGGGGHTTNDNGGSGGGVVRITVTNSSTINGTINADGGSDTRSGGGGGTVYLDVTNGLSGSGVISANGGQSTNNHGAGGGGRIAIHCGSYGYSGDVEAYGGQSNGEGEDGAAGTVYIDCGRTQDPFLLIDNGTISDDAYYATDLTSSTVTSTFNTIQVSNKARVWLDDSGGVFSFDVLQINEGTVFESDRSLNVITVATSSPSTRALFLNGGTLKVDNDISITTFDTNSGNATGTLTVSGELRIFSSELILGDQFTLETTNIFGYDDVLKVSDDMVTTTILSGGVLTHPHSTLTATNTLSFTTDVLDIQSGGSIDVEGRGYMGGRQQYTYTTVFFDSGEKFVITNNTNVGRTKGNVTVAQGYDLCGGSHGGRGGRYRNGTSGIGCGTAAGLEPHDVYDSIWDPQYPGSGGGGVTTNDNGGSGGGVVRITVTNSSTINGTINADGGSDTRSGGGGGTVYLDVTNGLSGSGVISANGGQSTNNHGAGGGGRIAIHCGSYGYSGDVEAYGGQSNGEGEDGAAGTVYIDCGRTQDPYLSVDNGSTSHDAYYPTYLNADNATDYETIEVDGYARLFVESNSTHSATTTQVNTNSYFESDRAESFTSVSSSPATGETVLYLNGGIAKFDSTLSLDRFDSEAYGTSGVLVTTATSTIADGIALIGNGLTWEIGSDILKTASTNLDRLVVASGGTLQHLYSRTTETYPIDMTVGELSVQFGGAINVEGRGYMGGYESYDYTTIYYESGEKQSHTNNTQFGKTEGNVTVSKGYDLCGGSHGGRGGHFSNGTSNNNCDKNGGEEPHDVYDSITNPVLPGSGGGGFSTNQDGGNGGGVIRFTVTNSSTIDGTLNADGGNGTRSGGGGGTVYLNVTNALSGSGIISATGGDSLSNHADGGGGRIAMYCGTYNFSGTVRANGAQSDQEGEDGAAGTIFTDCGRANDPYLLIDNQSSSQDAYYGTDLNATNAGTFALLQVAGYGRVFVESNSTHTATTTQVDTNSYYESDRDEAFTAVSSSPALGETALYLNGGVAKFDGMLTLDTLDSDAHGTSGDLVTMATTSILDGAPQIGSGFTWEIGGPIKKSGIDDLDRVTINSGGVLTHPYTTTAATNTLEFSVAELYIKSGGSINVSSRGYLGGYRSLDYEALHFDGAEKISTTNNIQQGRTYPNSIVSQGYDLCGGSHGGRGGHFSNGTSIDNCDIGGGEAPHDPYDSIVDPKYPGSGGGGLSISNYGGSGGGVVRITVTNSSTINGTILAEGQNGVRSGGGGGTIYLTVSTTLYGTGILRVDGADHSAAHAGGGGGRLAVHCGNNNYGGTMSAYGGISDGAGEDGAAGTVFVKCDGDEYGELTIQNCGSSCAQAYYNTSLLTTIPADDQVAQWNDGYVFDAISIANYGILDVPAAIDSTGDGDPNAATRKLYVDLCPTDDDSAVNGEIEYDHALYGDSSTDGFTNDYFCVPPANPTSSTIDEIYFTTSSGSTYAVVNFDLNEGTTSTGYVKGSFTDLNGCYQVAAFGTTTGAIYRSGSGACTNTDAVDCYVIPLTSCTISNCDTGNANDKTGDFVCSVDVEYYANPTVTGTPFEMDTWVAQVFAEDVDMLTGTGTSTFEMNTLTAVGVEPSFSYGTLALGATSTMDVSLTITNTGNTVADLSLFGTDLPCTIGSLPVEKQRFSTNTAQAYLDMTPHSSTPQSLPFNLPKQANSTTLSTSSLNWKVELSAFGLSGTCVGTTTISAQ